MVPVITPDIAAPITPVGASRNSSIRGSRAVSIGGGWLTRVSAIGTSPSENSRPTIAKVETSIGP